MKFIPRVLHYLRAYWPLAAVSIFLTVLAVGASLLTPWPLKILVDSVLGDHPLPAVLTHFLGSLAESPFTLLIVVVGAGLTLVMLENGLNVLNTFVHTKVEQRMILDFRSDLFKHAQRLPLAFYDQRRSGGLIYVINFQASAAAGLAMALQPLAQSGLTLLGMLWILLQIDRQVALLSLTVVPFLYYSVGYYAKYIQPRLRQVKGMEAEALSIIHEAVSMLRVIVAFGREGYQYQRFRNQGERAVDARVHLTVRQTLFSLVVNMITAVGTALVLGFGAYSVLQGRLTVGQLLVVLAYLASVYKPLESISSTIGSLQDKIVSLQMAYSLLDRDPEIKDAPGAIDVQHMQGRVTFENVHFSYTSRTDTLKNISFEVEAGQVVAIVGPTGAGKTTLVSLVPRFYEASQGRVLIDDRDIRQLTLASLRRQISIVLQEPLLFSGSIADNIRYGRLEATLDEVKEAAKAANAHDFIMKLPKKYQTQVGERGVQLSGGERQRICVARAFLKDAPILILDEPTSSVDSKTEAVILDALERLMVGRTTFMIAHRLSTIRNADIILVMHHGELIEQGSHDELLELGGLYSQLHAAQTGRARHRLHPALRAEPSDPAADRQDEAFAVVPAGARERSR